MMDKYILITFSFGYLLSVLAPTEGCLLPLSDGDWVSSTRGTWTTSNNGTHSVIENFEAALTTTATNQEITCVSSSGTQYIFGTRFELFFLVFIDVYTCIDIRTTSVSPNSYIYYVVTPTDSNTGEPFTSDFNSACTNSNFETAINTNILLNQGSETSAGVNCPDDILGNYTVDYSDVNGNSITGSDMDSCNDTKLMVFNNADSNTKLAFTNDNNLQCLHSITSGSSVYVHTYNTDTAPADDTNTFAIACWVIVKSDSQVQATVYPKECVQGQSSTSVPYGGQAFVFTPRYTCPVYTTDPEASNQTSSKEGLAGWQIALIVLGVLAAIFIIVIIILYIRYIRKERHVNDADPEKGDRQPSPDSLHNDDIDREKKSRIRRMEEDYDSGFDEKPRDKRTREHTFDLKEVKKPTKKLQDGKIGDKDVKTERSVNNERLTTDVKPPVAPIVFPPGKKPIPPTTPRPEGDDTALLRIKKEREKKERERLEKLEKKKKEKEAKSVKEKKKEKPTEEIVGKVIKTVRPTSSSEYETDESEKEERIQKLLQKRKRLAAAAYQPPEGLSDATVVGRKKQRVPKEGEDTGDLTKNLTTREQQELADTKRRQRKKAIKRMAKKKLKSPSDIETSDSDGNVSPSKRRHKRRKVGDPLGKEAPYIEKYNAKKVIEKGLDDIDYWHEKVEPTVISDDEEIDEDGNIKKRAIQVVPVETKMAAKGAEEKHGSRLEQIMEEEADVWAAHGFKGFKLGRGGELPEGFHFDNDGNIMRDVDGKVIPKEAFAKQMDSRRKFGFVFSLPRLIRDNDGRPLGGYKDDEFGPTAEWDYGLPSNNEEEDDLKKLESHRAGSGKQVAFSVQDGQTVQGAPLNDLDYSQIKGRQIGSAERLKLKERLFEQKPDSEVQTNVPVYFKNKTGGVKPESVYIDNKQVEGQEKKKAGPCLKQSMVVRSDTFDDGRRMSRTSKLRASWSGRESRVPAFIPEDVKAEERGIQGISREKRNIGSDDEFVLVPGSMKQLNKPPGTTNSHLATHWCSRYERQGHLRSREPTELSDLNMVTAPSSHRPFSGDDRKMKRLLQELYTDKKYFDHYLEAERLPTNAAVETRGLASHGVDFLIERAEYWNEHLPVNPPPPPSDLALRLSRMRTFHTVADSGMDSVMSSATGRPHSADDAQETIRTGRENSVIVAPLDSSRLIKTVELKEVENLERKPPTGRSEFAASPSNLESVKKEKTVTIDEFPRENGKLKSGEPKPESSLKPNMPAKGQTVFEESLLPGNVLTITDTST